MNSVTTIVRELDELSGELHNFSVTNDGETGLSVLARFFETRNDSELYEVISEIHKRVSVAHEQVYAVITDAYESDPAHGALGNITNAFSAAVLVQQWNNGTKRLLVPTNTNALRSVSGQIRASFPVPRLTNEQASELLVEAESLIAFIELKHVTEPRVDIQTSLMVEGLKLFCTRLKRLKWVGANSTIEALRQFLGAASALEQADKKHTDISSVLEKSREFWTKASEAFGFVSKTYTAGKFFVTAWQEVNAALKSDVAQQLLQLGHEAQKMLPPPT